MSSEYSSGTPGEPSPQIISDILGLASATVFPEVVATWPVKWREEAVEWAGREHLSTSDNLEVDRIPQPEFVQSAARICFSPAMAQLAVEAWTDWLGDADLRSPQEGLRIAQEAVTALLVLSRERQPS